MGGLRGLTRVQLLVLLDVIGATALMFSGHRSRMEHPPVPAAGPVLQLSQQQRQAFDSLLFNGDNSVLLNKVPPGLHDQTVTAANTALTGGLQAALGCAAILLLIGAVLTLIRVRGSLEKSWLDVD